MTRAGIPVLLAAALASAGCISYKSGIRLPDPAGIRLGETTRGEVYERFGLPDGIRRRAEGTVLTYEIAAGRGWAVSAGWSGASFSTTETRFTRQSLEILLDEGDRVAGARWTDGLGRAREIGTE